MLLWTHIIMVSVGYAQLSIITSLDCIQFDVYVLKDNTDWRAMMPFAQDDILKLASMITSLHDSMLTVSNQLYANFHINN